VSGGTLTLTGTNTYTGVATVNGGTLNVSSGALTSGNAAGSSLNVGSTAGANSILGISGGTVTARTSGSQFVSSLLVGGTAGSVGAVRMTGGTLTNGQQLGLGGGNGGYAAMTMTGGTATSGSYLVVGFNNDRAVFDQTGGSFTINTNIMTIGAGGTGSIGVANIGGNATFTSIGTTGNSPGGIIVGERGHGELNVSGTANLTLGNTGLSVGPTATQNGWNGTANLLGGTVNTTHITKGLGTGTAYLNLNGGTVRATAASATFISGLDGAYIYSGGTTIDSNGFDVTVTQALNAPTDSGVSSIAVTAPGSGFIGTPIVSITGGTVAAGGSPATGVATIDPNTGQVTGITITNPGSYTDTSSVSVALLG
jgi:hypothetical protein